MPQCPSCSAEIHETSRFCSVCGAPVDPAGMTPTKTSIRPGAPKASPAGERARGSVAGDAARGGVGGATRGGAVGGASPGEARFIPGVMLAGRYRIVGLLGKGGMGEVYRADDLKLGQPVALKFLPESLARDEERLERFFGEVRTARRVTHANVCRVYDVSDVDGQHYISMEYVDGEDLATLLRRIGHLPKEKAIQIARQICAGLAAAHDQGILHRDLKPANVMIDGRGGVRITDFGLAGLAEERQEGFAGTPGYMAPEQFAGKPASVRSDIYALGLVLYELFTGRKAVQGESLAEIVELHKESTPTSPSALVDGFDPAVERVILRCLEKDPAQRPASALSVAAALPGGDPLAAALAAGETPSPELVAAAGSADAMNPALAFGIAAACVILFAVGLRMNGANQLRAFAPLNKPPAAMVDRAQEIVRKLGYTEEIYSRPVDTAYGYSVWVQQIDWIENNDSSADRWEVLRRPRPGVVTFWYRQKPEPLIPSVIEFGSFAPGPVERWDPFPDTPGEILVSLDAEGRMEFFVHTPRQYKEEPIPSAEPEWSFFFDLAGLDIEDFTRVESRYQRFMEPDQRAAWVGFYPEDPEHEIRIEIGVSEGRLVLFATLSPWELDNLGAAPATRSSPPTGLAVFLWMIVALLFGSALLARWNIRRGRADRRGAYRFAIFVFAATFLQEVLRAHNFFSMVGAMSQIFQILATALFHACAAWAVYVALEPFARRIWPSMLVSWSRLVSTGRRWRDPVVGRAILAGLLVAAALSLLTPLQHLIQTALEGAPHRPTIGGWDLLLGQRQVLAMIIYVCLGGMARGLFLTFVLVLGRMITRSQSLAAVATVIIWAIFEAGGGISAQSPLVEIAFDCLWGAVLVAVLLRFGLVSLMASIIVVFLARTGPTADWSAWHAQPAFLCLAAVAALAAYGFWASSAGRSLAREGET